MRLVSWLRARPKTLASAAGVTVGVVALTTMALTYEGLPTAKVDLNDGGVWITKSSSLLVGHFNHESTESSAVVRWLFMSPGVTVVANLEVRSPRGVMPLAVIAEDLVLSTQLQGAGAENPEVFDPAALATVVDVDDRAWRL